MSGYSANITSASQYLNAIGGTVDNTYLTAMETIIAADASAFTGEPKYASQRTYV